MYLRDRPGVPGLVNRADADVDRRAAVEGVKGQALGREGVAGVGRADLERGGEVRGDGQVFVRVANLVDGRAPAHAVVAGRGPAETYLARAEGRLQVRRRGGRRRVGRVERVERVARVEAAARHGREVERVGRLARERQRVAHPRDRDVGPLGD